jgi:hypothetical protein
MFSENLTSALIFPTQSIIDKKTENNILQKYKQGNINPVVVLILKGEMNVDSKVR